MGTDIHHQAVIVSLEPLLKEAEANDLWLYHLGSAGDEIWASPQFLRLELSHGRLLLSANHWELRNPVGYMKKLIADAHAIIREYNDLADRLGYEETLALGSHSTNPADAH